MKYLRWLLFPFSLVYGLVVIIRNWCYRTSIFKSEEFNFPIISVGNLNVGGAGKSPMTEYLVRLLKNEYKLATLSRGYGRTTKGFLIADNASTAATIGDEPAQFKQKFPDITVAVCEKRAVGIQELIPNHEIIILDDAYQHRAVKPGLSILLFDYTTINEPHLMLPAGNLREPFSGRQRAHALVVSKCPPQITMHQQDEIIKRIRPYAHQQVFFTAISYLPMRDMEGMAVSGEIDADTTVFLLTGIANTQPLLKHIRQFTQNVIHHKYPDHHQFGPKNITKLAEAFHVCNTSSKIIITTEKDAQRLREPALLPYTEALPVWVLPIGIQFLNNGKQPFNQIINHYVREHTTHRSIH
ncbi:tetraacyldisaccharide 4'-kinase [Mucilaginibacter sp. Bleaf8]|uniref:tetraacyldisaccharide 4'-kinase n=1 Tax=Mucilaginibacter sp. Bleaf8 TaxID=2834430 RepID=UPI001BCEEA09|nr:tetraacyldisaccharide 4'-kinase [Mucilaginibacter sp. Bleaf8]MBS7566361.1 tetraacyldisaccharide 4'-kinase [Mucilaginibacter sp. Bleaf8]